MTMDTAFEHALRRELTQLPTAHKRHRRRRTAITIIGALGLIGAGSVSVANLRPPAEVITMPIAPPMVISGTGISMVKFAPVPEKARYLRVELACFSSKVCGFAEQENVSTTTAPLLIERAALPVTDWYDPEDQARLNVVDPLIGFTVKVDPGALWRMYAIYTEELNPKSAQLPSDPAYGSDKLIGIPNNNDYQGQMFIPVVASNNKLGWIHYDTLMGAVPGTQKIAMPVFDIDCKTMIGSIDLN